MPDEPVTYGSSERYLGENGEAYFDYQNQGALQRGRINARKFAPFIQPTDTIIDFGCGSGALLASLNCQHRIGIDINPAARQEAAKNGVEVYATLSEISSGLADIVISNHALEHIPYPLQALSELRQKLIKGGRLVLYVPIDDWRMERHVDIHDVNHHLYTWTPLLMGNLLQEAGYKIERVSIYTHAWPPAWQKLDSKLPVSVFDRVCYFYSWWTKRRQLIAVATNDS